MNHRNCNSELRPEHPAASLPSVSVCAPAPGRSWFGTDTPAAAWLRSHAVPAGGGTAGCQPRVGRCDSPLGVSPWRLGQVNWLPEAKHGTHCRLLSVSTDGKILVWREERDGRLALAEGFAVVAQQIPRSARLKVSAAVHRGLASQKHSTLEHTWRSLSFTCEGPGKAPVEHNVLNHGPHLLSHAEIALWKTGYSQVLPCSKGKLLSWRTCSQ